VALLLLGRSEVWLGEPKLDAQTHLHTRLTEIVPCLVPVCFFFRINTNRDARRRRRGVQLSAVSSQPLRHQPSRPSQAKQDSSKQAKSEMVTTRRMSTGATPAKARSAKAASSPTTPSRRSSKAAPATPSGSRTPRRGAAATTTAAAAAAAGKRSGGSGGGGGTSSSAAADAKAKAIRLLLKAMGIYACFIYWGIVQERVTTTEYQPAPGLGGKPGRYSSMIALNGAFDQSTKLHRSPLTPSNCARSDALAACVRVCCAIDPTRETAHGTNVGRRSHRALFNIYFTTNAHHTTPQQRPWLWRPASSAWSCMRSPGASLPRSPRSGGRPSPTPSPRPSAVSIKHRTGLGVGAESEREGKATHRPFAPAPAQTSRCGTSASP
jgi:hypothetical protein